MSNLKLVIGSLFDSKEKYICHQCNSVTNVGAHLAKDMFNKFPYANIYKERTRYEKPKKDHLPGNIIIMGNGQDQRYVINMIAQYFPGKPKFLNGNLDGTKSRENYFQNCLDKISLIHNLESIAFPFQIGCGAAGGNWIAYRKMIKNFAEQVKIPVVIYKKN